MAPSEMSPRHRTARAGSTRILAVVGALLAGLLVLTACGGSPSPRSGSDGAPTRSITDVTGTTVAVPAQPKRVVTLSELDLDSTLALGVTPVGATAGRGQQGLPRYLADRAKGVPLVGTVTGPRMAKVIKARPDLILAGQVRDKQVLSKLREIAPTVVTFKVGDTWKSAFENVANALGRRDAEQGVLATYHKKLDAVKHALGPNADAVVSVVRWNPKGPSTINKGTFASLVLADLGVRRPSGQRKPAVHSMPLSMENLDEIDADWLFVGTLTAHGADATALRSAKSNPAFAALHAVKEHHVATVDGSKWMSLGGPLAASSVLDDVRRAMAAS